MTTDLFLNKTTHDIELDGRDLKITETDDVVAQRLTIALQFLLNEWFLDTTKGIPFTQTITEAGSGDLETLTIIFRNQINKVEGVIKINEINLTKPGEDRILSVAIRVNDTITTEVTI